MDFSRRGFFGLLGGTVLGKIVGPRLLAEPTAETWALNRTLAPTPEISYLPLEAASYEILRLMDQELRWLRLKRLYADPWRGYRLGDSIMIRELSGFVPWPEPDFVFESRLNWPRRVNLINHAQAVFEMPEARRFGGRWGEVAEYRIMPTAFSLAEQVIEDVRRNGGAKCLIGADLTVPAGVARTIIARSEETGLSIRATQYVGEEIESGSPNLCGRPIPKLCVEMLYGLA